MINVKLNRYKIELLDFIDHVVIKDSLMAACASDAIVIATDKYKRKIDKLRLNVRVSLMID